ncbi:MAG: cell division protein FtsA [Acidobacteriia bacterium]|nr:cell division protein FtsA [Terriglobia bacterium]
MAEKIKYVIGLDLGSSKICAVICEINETGGLDLVGFGSTESKGLSRGVVVNLDAAAAVIKQSVEEAERAAETVVESVFVGVSGEHVKSFNSRGAVSISTDDREISVEHIELVIDRAKEAISLPSDVKIVHMIPQAFVVDGQEGIKEPLGLLGGHLEVGCHVITASNLAHQNVVTAVNRAGVVVNDTILQQLASAESTLSNDDKELGVAVIDIGGGTTDLAIFTQGALRHTFILPLAGDQITNDIAVGLRTTIPEAERIKRKYGCALPRLIPEELSFSVSSVGGRKPKSIGKKILCEIVQARMEEILLLIQEEIKHVGFDRKLGAGLVLTGGTAQLEGVVELAEEKMDLPVRLGTPMGLDKMETVLLNSTYSTAIGLVLYGYRTHFRTITKVNTNSNIFSRLWSLVKNQS